MGGQCHNYVPEIKAHLVISMVDRIPKRWWNGLLKSLLLGDLLFPKYWTREWNVWGACPDGNSNRLVVSNDHKVHHRTGSRTPLAALSFQSPVPSGSCFYQRPLFKFKVNQFSSDLHPWVNNSFQIQKILSFRWTEQNKLSLLKDLL